MGVNGNANAIEVLLQDGSSREASTFRSMDNPLVIYSLDRELNPNSESLIKSIHSKNSCVVLTQFGSNMDKPKCWIKKMEFTKLNPIAGFVHF